MSEESSAGSERLGPDTIPRDGSIVIVDLSGFTALVLEKGIAAALARIWSMRRQLIPLFRACGGEVYKVDADNLFIFFDSLAAAVEASIAAHEQLASSGDFAVSIGLGFGMHHYVASEDDYYGEEINLAAKLGEDVAAAGELLLTAAAAATAGGLPDVSLEQRTTTIGTLRIAFFSLTRHTS